jgi:hypothetical protein
LGWGFIRPHAQYIDAFWGKSNEKIKFALEREVAFSWLGEISLLGFRWRFEVAFKVFGVIEVFVWIRD